MALSKGCTWYKKGQVIFHEGAYPSGIYVINNGKVKVFKLGLEGKEQIVRLADKGEILGYRSLIGGDKYAATAAVFEDSMVCFIGRETLFKLIETNPLLSMKIMELLAIDLKKAENRMTHLAQDTVRERLAQTLLLLKETFGLREDDFSLNVSLSREDLSNIVGTATETVIRLLSEFQKDKLIKLNRKHICILDSNGLLKVARVTD